MNISSELTKMNEECQNIENFVFSVKVGNSVLSYAKTVLSSDTADNNLKNLVKTLYLYNQKANEFSETQGSN